jgi:glutamate:GABA antiporter
VASVGMLAAAAGIVIGLVPPSQFSQGSPVLYVVGLAAGVLILAVPPQIIYQLRRPAWRDSAVAAAETA